VRAHAIFGLGAAVYTQMTDIEIEIDGLMTYDRAVIKVKDTDEIKKYAMKLYPTESVANILLQSGIKFDFNNTNLKTNY
jgi:hypothetical protein